MNGICTKCGVVTGNKNHTCDPIDIEQLMEDLLGAFGANVNIQPYYSVLKDLCAKGNWLALSAEIAALSAAGKISAEEIVTLKAVLANQDVTLPEV